MHDEFDTLLAPLAHLMVACDVPFQDLSEQLKGHFVQAAMAQGSGKVTDSMLSLKTGLSRREVARMRAFESKPAKPNPLTRLVWLWRNEATYCNADGPRALPRTGEGSFETLARLVLQDVHPRSLLSVLEEADTVSVDDTHVTLIKEAYIPRTGGPEQRAYLAENVGDHLEAATQNLAKTSDPYFERALHYTGLTDAQAQDLEQQFASAQMALLKQLSTQAETMKASNAGNGTTRFRAGGYVFYASETDT